MALKVVENNKKQQETRDTGENKDYWVHHVPEFGFFL